MERSELVSEAQELAEAAVAGTPGTFTASASNPDAVVASLAARAAVDGLVPSGRMRSAKRGILAASMVFLRDQASFNRLTVTAVEDLSARLDAVEARLRELEEPGRAVETDG